jgi:hypothetical protein
MQLGTVDTVIGPGFFFALACKVASPTLTALYWKVALIV